MTMDLRALQREFALGLRDASAVPRGIRARRPGAARRFGAYRNNVLSNYVGALADVYPVVHKLVGEAFFGFAARRFARSVPSRSGDLDDYGREFAPFLGQLREAAGLAYLADVARLEWAWHEAFHAADAAALDIARLATVPAERQAALRLLAHPSVRLVASAYPIVRIWEVSQDGFAGDPAVDPASNADLALIVRDEAYRIGIERLAAGPFRLLESVLAGAPLAQALESALAVDPALEAGRALGGLVKRGVFSGFALD